MNDIIPNSTKMNKTLYDEFLKFIDSILKKKDILAIPGEALMIKKQFYQFFEQPLFEEEPAREELNGSLKEYNKLYTPIKRLIQKYDIARTSGYDQEGDKKETLKIMRAIEEDIDRAIKKIDSEIGRVQEDVQITVAEKSMFKAKRSNILAIIALIVSIVSIIISLCIN